MRLIDVDALMEEFVKFVRESNNSDFAPIPTWNDAVSLTGSAPTVDAVERKRGEWKEENRRPKSMMFYCSECHRTAYDPQNHHGGQKRCRYAFCPNCGAEMEQC